MYFFLILRPNLLLVFCLLVIFFLCTKLAQLSMLLPSFYKWTFVGYLVYLVAGNKTSWTLSILGAPANRHITYNHDNPCTTVIYFSVITFYTRKFVRMDVCLLLFYSKNTVQFWMKFGRQILYTQDYKLSYFLSQQHNSVEQFKTPHAGKAVIRSYI